MSGRKDKDCPFNPQTACTNYCAWFRDDEISCLFLSFLWEIRMELTGINESLNDTCNMLVGLAEDVNGGEQ